MPPYKWGVCLDFDTYDIGLFQTVVQYTADEAGEMAIIMSPVTMIHCDSCEKIKYKGASDTPAIQLWGKDSPS